MKRYFYFFIMLLASPFISHSQQFKTIKPVKITPRDISEKAQQEYKKQQQLFADVAAGKKQYEDLSDDEKDIYDGGPDLEEGFFNTISTGCSWYCAGGPDSIYASSQLKNYKNITYHASNIHDGNLSTAWIEGVDSFGRGETVTFLFAPNSPPVTSVLVYTGYMKSEKAWRDNSRPASLRLYINDKPYAHLLLENVMGEQRFEIDTFQSKRSGKPLKLTFEIYNVNAGNVYQETAISEINFDGIGVHCFIAGTMVMMADGSEKPIEKVAMDDEVLSFNTEKQQYETTKVSALINAKHHNLINIRTSEGEITTTDDHPFYVEGKGWLAFNAAAYSLYSGLNNNKNILSAGDEITGIKKNLKIISIEPLATCLPAYTLLLESSNCFFANGMLVNAETVKGFAKP